ncbi:protein SFI1 homolog [Lingula anatina]|uniref:Protein SFI1 homolog n=1 Tax=Lingula anatina TaxID=7574 RepID=A0A1S3HJD4_LINAN|nr:protein SFI1 homolog [Lingula anatina]|eukprot:XP_013386122.1 protein SFI1 homolog [Lingula anatina]
MDHLSKGSSMQDAKVKADRFAALTDAGNIRVKAKQAILQELNTQLQIKAERVRMLTRQGADSSDNPYASPGYEHHRKLPRAENMNPISLPPKVNRQSPRPRGGKRTDADSGLLVQAPPTVSQGSKIPLSTVRKRRKESKRHRPDYTWNKGGRLKEIRIRHLARKYLYIWIRKTFGRVLPSVARKHHNTQVLKQAFAEWYELWWVARKEWRLQVRAECHNRYRVWNVVFKAWTRYTVLQKVKNAKKAMAERHGNVRVLSRAWQAWRLYIRIRRTKKGLSTRARVFATENLLRSCWIRWVMAFDKRQEQKDVEVFALQIWAEKLQAQCWLKWKAAFKARQQVYFKSRVAEKHRDVRLLSRCWKGWLLHVIIRRRKKTQKDVAMMMYQNNLKQRLFRIWCKRCHAARLVAQVQERIEILRNRARARRTLEHWKFYINLRQKKKEKEQQADEHYRKHLMSSCLSALQLNVVQERLQVMRKRMADQCYNQMLLQKTWNKWIACCDQNEELKLYTVNKKAWTHYKMTLLGTSFEKWVNYNIWRQHRKAQYARADAHYINRLMPMCVFRWRQFVNLMKQKREMENDGKEFRRENLLARFFYTWMERCKQSQEVRLMERMAILHDSEMTTRRFLLKWRNATKERQVDMKKEENAHDHYQITLMSQAFETWKTFIRDSRKSYESEKKAVRYHYLKTMGVTWKGWRKYIGYERRKKTKLHRAVVFHNQKICGKVIGHWKEYCRRAAVINEEVERRAQIHDKELQRRCLIQWHRNAVEQKQNKQQEAKADKFHGHIALKKVFSAWREYANVHAYEHKKTAEKLLSAQQHLGKVKLHYILTRWYQLKNGAVIQRLKFQQAVEHHNNTLRMRTITVWKNYTVLCQRKLLLQKQCMWLYTTRLTAKFFLKWRAQFAEAQEDHTKNNMALWQWSFVLQRKVFLAWQTYTHERHRKKARIELAMEQRRLRLIRQGCGQWLKVATELSEVRSKLAAERQAQTAYNIYQLVHKCALHWRQWTIKRKAARLEQGITGAPLPGGESGTGRNAPARPLEKHRGVPGSSRPTQSVASPLRSLNLPGKHQAGVRALESALLGPNVIRPSRPRPRRPDFLIDSLKRDGLYHPTPQKATLHTNSSHPMTEPSIQMALKGFSPAMAEDEESQLQNVQPTVLTSQEPVVQPGVIPRTDKDNGKPDASNTGVLSSIAKGSRSNVCSNADVGIKPQIRHSPTLPMASSSGPKLQQITTAHKPSDILMTPAMFMTAPSDGSEQASPQRPVLPSGNLMTEASVLTPTKKGVQIPLTPSTSTPEKHSGKENGKMLLKPDDFIQSPPGAHKLSKEQELTDIRNKLQEYNDKKKKLRLLREQEGHLREWLEEQQIDGKSVEEQHEDVDQVKEELEEISKEILEFTLWLHKERNTCQRLKERAKNILAELQQIIS